MYNDSACLLRLYSTKLYLLRRKSTEKMGEDNFMNEINGFTKVESAIAMLSREDLQKVLLTMVQSPELQSSAVLNEFFKNSNSDEGHSLDRQISKIFVSIGIPPHIKGYQYLRTAIKTCVKDTSIISSITKRLYPDVAKEYDSTPSKVERAIRHAIEVCWNRGKIDSINNIFGSQVFTKNDRPTNGEFIALLADKLLLDDCHE
ncbi:MAG: sporulation initiation factor Spo0A C-terminal domain-containing protein [Clostridia bacterium]|nr:sporulation initiation factor Spo0A C-terminal domain-containing protein [Clostridia bacterium]